ncbi:MAG: GEGP motif-containing diheme protein [bacterium]
MKRNEWKRKTFVLLTVMSFAIAGGMVFIQGCGSSDDGSGDMVCSSRAYKGHASDRDINNFVQVYPHTVGTRLDDCQTCHTGGEITVTETEGNTTEVETEWKNSCDYCHYIPYPPEPHSISGETVTGYPKTYYDTLNGYGKDYMDNGRDKGALTTIAGLDSDGDSFLNHEEIADLRYPGDSGSKPGQKLCPMRTVTVSELKGMTAHSQFMLANTTKQQFDFYANWKGVKIIDILQGESVDLSGAKSIDILAPDGFTKSFSVSEITDQYPYHKFFSGFGAADLGSDCAFVEYPADTRGYAYGDTITDDQYHILAYEREGQPLEESYLDPSSGKIGGEGPLRNIIPPGATDDQYNQPDRGKYADTSGCGLPEWDYDFNKDHNAHNMVKGAVIIRIQPMPTGCEEFDINNGGWALIDAGELLIYGHGVTAE